MKTTNPVNQAQCPHCQSIFSVSQEEIRLALGAVRCGECIKIFNASYHLIDAEHLANAPYNNADTDHIYNEPDAFTIDSNLTYLDPNLASYDERAAALKKQFSLPTLQEPVQQPSRQTQFANPAEPMQGHQNTLETETEKPAFGEGAYNLKGYSEKEYSEGYSEKEHSEQNDSKKSFQEHYFQEQDYDKYDDYEEEALDRWRRILSTYFKKITPPMMAGIFLLLATVVTSSWLFINQAPPVYYAFTDVQLVASSNNKVNIHFKINNTTRENLPLPNLTIQLLNLSLQPVSSEFVLATELKPYVTELAAAATLEMQVSVERPTIFVQGAHIQAHLNDSKL